ncbi:hypothetical protein JDFR1000234_28 [uncultured archaeal virus]|jgi:hypothetical protein|uniref:Uncharacterized protein n=1 Tax=uncultured archaeal virus TaxID=1960247 RepID=A0A1S5Y380_9VIRU|nr:hypothetical protein JDFR1000234_28 [uncultured archaeal virus]
MSVETHKIKILQFPNQKVTLRFVVDYQLNKYVGVTIAFKKRGKSKMVYLPLHDVKEFSENLKALPKYMIKDVLKTISSVV